MPGDLMGLQEHRSEIEEIDEQIIKLINRRISISKKIFEAKRLEGKPISDPEREKRVLSRATDLATELNLDAGAVKSIFQTLIAMSINKQQELQGRDQG
ncbi:MAG: chorismate mutase [Methanothrix sp.]|jgi:chorismate mutase|nr:chorismate mutase [Methanothrix sp.]MDD4579613.1 chorismate mutase [Methanothrix sp.]